MDANNSVSSEIADAQTDLRLRTFCIRLDPILVLIANLDTRRYSANTNVKTLHKKKKEV